MILQNHPFFLCFIWKNPKTSVMYHVYLILQLKKVIGGVFL